MARLFGRPLYCLSFAELGTTVAELEEKLTDVLQLASLWGALVLLDEGDALVERRQRGQLLLNSMSAVLLRLHFTQKTVDMSLRVVAPLD